MSLIDFYMLFKYYVGYSGCVLSERVVGDECWDFDVKM